MSAELGINGTIRRMKEPASGYVIGCGRSPPTMNGNAIQFMEQSEKSCKRKFAIHDGKAVNSYNTENRPLCSFILFQVNVPACIDFLFHLFSSFRIQIRPINDGCRFVRDQMSFFRT